MSHIRAEVERLLNNEAAMEQWFQQGICSQKDRETAADQMRRAVIALQATARHAAGMLPIQEEEGCVDPAVSKHLPESLTDEVYAAQEGVTRLLAIAQAYDYFLARCFEAGFTPEFAKDAWQRHATPDVLDVLVEAECYAAMGILLVDRYILSKFGLTPRDEGRGGDDAC